MDYVGDEICDVGVVGVYWVKFFGVVVSGLLSICKKMIRKLVFYKGAMGYY